MSYFMHFTLTTGLSRPMRVPKGTLEACQDHVQRVEKTLHLRSTKYRDNPRRWDTRRLGRRVSDEVLCKVVEEHNRWVRWMYGCFTKWSEAASEKKPLTSGWHVRPYRTGHDDAFMLISGNYGKSVETEELTPEGAQTFWHGLELLDVPLSRWTMEFYRNRMEHLYEVMRGRESEGVTLNAKKALTPKQAAAVICLFAEYMDPGDLRLDVARGHDHLTSSYDGGYEWCEKCGAVDPDDASGCTKKACPILAERDSNLAKDDPDRRRWVLKDKAAGVYVGREPGAWPTALGKGVLHFEDRDDAEKRIASYPNRALVVVPVRRGF